MRFLIKLTQALIAIAIIVVMIPTFIVFICLFTIATILDFLFGELSLTSN